MKLRSSHSYAYQHRAKATPSVNPSMDKSIHKAIASTEYQKTQAQQSD